MSDARTTRGAGYPMWSYSRIICGMYTILN